MQKFEGASMPEALRRVKQALGDSAVIIGTRTTGGNGSSRRVEITAVGGKGHQPVNQPPKARNVVSYEGVAGCKPWNVEKTIPSDEQLIRKLVENEVARDVAQSIVQQARKTAGIGSPESVRAAL